MLDDDSCAPYAHFHTCISILDGKSTWLIAQTAGKAKQVIPIPAVTDGAALGPGDGGEGGHTLRQEVGGHLVLLI